jgi:outer membrane protein OmpA-like peptidoglycan-associated protein/tetratricopeptide (TPR) repeat protein
MTRLRGLIIVIILFFGNHSKGQWYDPEKINKKTRQIYEQAYDLAMQGDYMESIHKIDVCIKMDPRFVEAYLSRAGIYASIKKYDSSVLDFSRAFELDLLFCNTYLLPYSISLAGVGRFQDAMNKIDLFLSLGGLNEQSIKAANYRKKTYQFALDQEKLFSSNAYHYTPESLGDNINSSFLEYYPSLTIDEKKMIFTRRVNDDEDFYESNFENGIWSLAKPASGRINTNFNEGAQCLSQDGQWLIFTGCNYPEGEGSCDLYISYLKKDSTWTEAVNLGRIINSEFWESAPTLSSDKKDLYFSSNRPGGFGGKDIWISHRLASGKWSSPENAGNIINTSADETCPFIHADNQTLYFNSNGHPGYGQSDLFLSRKDSSGFWNKPVNLGYPVNTIDDEGSIIVAADGMRAYFASDHQTNNKKLDLFTFSLPNYARSIQTKWISGNVINKKNGIGLPSTIMLTEMSRRKQPIRIQSDENGQFLVTLPVPGDYAIQIERKGFLLYSERVQLEAENSDTSFQWKIPLSPIEPGEKIVLRNVFFETGSSKLSTLSQTELDELVLMLKENPGIKIEVQGHTDNQGKPADNLKLSILRAQSVSNYLKAKGISSARLSVNGYGDKRPITQNDTEQGKSLNRRTEIHVISVQ